MPTTLEPRTMEPLAESLLFNRRWWVDPVPDWIIHSLDKATIRELAVNQLQLQRHMLEAQLKSIEQTLNILGKTR